MSDFVPPGSLNWSCILNSSSLPPPLLSAPVVPLLPLVPAALAAALGLAIWLWRNPALFLGELPVDQGAVIIAELQPALQIRPIAADEEIPPSPPAVTVEEHPPDEQDIIGDGSQLAAAVRALRDYVEARIRSSGCQSPIAHSLFDSESDCDSDSSGSSSSRDEWWKHLQLHHLDLEVEPATLIPPNWLARLEQMLRNFPEAQRLEMFRAICPRFCDALENALLLNVDPKAFSDPRALTDESTKNRVLRLIIAAKICRLMWHQLVEPNQQLYPDLKGCFAEVAERSMDNLLNVASLFSNASWFASHIMHMLPIFHTLVDILCNIQELPFSRSDTIRNKVTDIYAKMVNSMCGILQKTSNDTRIRKKSTIHPATGYLIQALRFFYHNKDMLQAVLGSRDDTFGLHNCWVWKLEEDAGRMFKNKEDQQCIFILNDAWFVRQKKSDPSRFISDKQAKSVDSLIQEYMKKYLDKFWRPHLTCQDSSRRQHHLSLSKFNIICSGQTKWKVRTELKMKLRKEILDLGLGPEGIFSRHSNELKMVRSRKYWFPFQKKQEKLTLAVFKNAVNALFER